MEANGRGSLLARILRRVGLSVPALFVLALGLVISIAAWRFTEQRVAAEAESKFQHEVAQAVGALDRRFQDNVNLLVGLRGLFVASDRVDRDDFQRYLSGFNLRQRYAGVRLVSYVQYVPGSEKTRFEESVRRDRSIDPRGYPEFAIKPPGMRGDYMVVTYIEPFAGNERAFGFDVYSERQRRPAVEFARDSGRVTASEPIWLAADASRQISVALRMPVYRRGMPNARSRSDVRHSSASFPRRSTWKTWRADCWAGSSGAISTSRSTTSDLREWTRRMRSRSAITWCSTAAGRSAEAWNRTAPTQP